MKFLECFLKLFHLLIRGSMKGLSRNLAISSRSSIEMHLFVMLYGIKARRVFVKAFKKFLYLLIMEIILE